MITFPIPKGWYGFCNPNGDYRVVVRDIGVRSGNVNSSDITTILIQSPGNNCLFLQLSPDSTDFCGKSHLNDDYLLYANGVWNWTPIPTWGNSPVIYDNDGVLSIISEAPGVGASGYGYCDYETNELVSGDNAHGPIKGLFDVTYLGDNVWVGQIADKPGVHEGKTGVFANGKLRLLSDDPSRFIRARRKNEDVGIYWWNVDSSPAKAIKCTMGELKALPVYEEVVDNFGVTGPASPINFLIPDTTKYVFGSLNNKPRTKDHLMEQVEIAPNLFAYVKFGDKNAYELWAKTAYGTEHLEDASDSAGTIVKRFVDTRWIPKVLKVGRANGVSIPEHDEIWMRRTDCIETNRVPSVREIWILAHYKEFDCGPDLGKKEVIAVVYDPTGEAHTPGRYMEVNYFALDIGWIWWQSHKSWVVFATGSPVFSAVSLADNKKFYLNSNQTTIPSITGCAIPPVVIPPSSLKKPEVTVTNWKPDATVDGWVFEGIDRENPGFGFKVWTENGSFYASFTNPIGSGRTGATRLYKKCATTTPPVEPPVPIPPSAISKVRVDNLLFKDEQNNIFPYRGFSSFLLLKKFLDGENIVPYCKAWSALGYNVARVFSQVDWTGSPGPGFVPSSYPNYNAQLINFLNLLSQNGLYCELVVHTFDYNLQEMANHVLRLSNIITNHKNVFLEIANEPPVNNIDIVGLLNLLNMSSVNYPYATGQYFPTATPAGTYVTTHTPRDNEWPRKAKYLIEYHQGGAPESPSDPQFLMPIVADEPMGGADFISLGRRSNVPSDFYSYGALAQLMGAGATFHHESGLNSIMPDGIELDCAKAFITGMRLVDTKYQTGSYTRVGLSDSPIKSDNSLRTYGMILGNLACMVRVRPTIPYEVDPNWRVTSEDNQKIVITLSRI